MRNSIKNFAKIKCKKTTKAYSLQKHSSIGIWLHTSMHILNDAALKILKLIALVQKAYEMRKLLPLLDYNT